MIFISPILTAVTLITVPLMFLSAKGIVKRSRKYFKAQQEALGMMNGYAEEMISGQKVVKVFGHEPEGGNRLRDTEPKPEGQIVESTILTRG